VIYESQVERADGISAASPRGFIADARANQSGDAGGCCLRLADTIPPGGARFNNRVSAATSLVRPRAKLSLGFAGSHRKACFLVVNTAANFADPLA
jgi:hypothetical protein